MDKKVDMSQQHVLTVQNAKLLLDCIKSSMASRSMEMILPFHSAPVRAHLECCICLWGPQHKKDVDLLE